MSAPDLVPPGTTGGGAPVGGSGTIGTVPKWATTTTLNNSVITQSGSNVGIGVAIPGAVLDVLGTSADTDFRVSRTGGSPYFAISAPGGADTLSQFFVSGVSVMGLTTGGRVGIGTVTTNPACALDVAGTVKTAGYTVATLPAGGAGQRAYVTDATAPTYLGALVGGGAVVVPVFHNGTAWVSA